MKLIYTTEPYGKFLDTVKSKTTKSRYASGLDHLVAFFDSISESPKTVSKEQMHKFLEYLNLKYINKGTVFQYRDGVKKLFGYLRETEYRSDDPSLDLPRVEYAHTPGEKISLTPEQIEKLVSVLEFDASRIVSWQKSLMILLILHCGLDRKEISTLSWKNIDLDAKRFLSLGGVPTHIPISDFLTKKLTEYKELFFSGDDVERKFIFFKKDNAEKHLSKELVSTNINQVLNQTFSHELPKHCTSLLFDTFINQLIRSGTPIQNVFRLSRMKYEPFWQYFEQEISADTLIEAQYREVF